MTLAPQRPTPSTDEREGEFSNAGRISLAGKVTSAACSLAMVAVCLAIGGQQARAQTTPGIYTCTDAKGHRLTSDRPIPECLDREQRELSQTGATKRILGASLTADERAREEAKQQQEAAIKAKANEERRKDRALISRYPSPRLHAEERGKQLAQVDEVIASIHLRTQDLQKQRETLNLEMEFYKNNPSKAPAWLVRRLEDNQQQQEGQLKLVAAQAQEKQRINARFDEELLRLKTLWVPVVPNGPPNR